MVEGHGLDVGPKGHTPVVGLAGWVAVMILERDGELDRLHRVLDDVGTSGGRVVLVRGDIGLTRRRVHSEASVNRSCGDAREFATTRLDGAVCH